MLRLQEGKYYRTRDGRKVGPMVDSSPYHSGYSHAVHLDGKTRVFQSDGTHGAEYVPNIHGYDLVAEWTEGPVRTVTRTVTEIVDGTYGGVTVDGTLTFNGSPRVSFSGNPTATELKAAAAVLLELAGALEGE